MRLFGYSESDLIDMYQKRNAKGLIKALNYTKDPSIQAIAAIDLSYLAHDNSNFRIDQESAIDQLIVMLHETLVKLDNFFWDTVDEIRDYSRDIHEYERYLGARNREPYPIPNPNGTCPALTHDFYNKLRIAEAIIFLLSKFKTEIMQEKLPEVKAAVFLAMLSGHASVREEAAVTLSTLGEPKWQKMLEEDDSEQFDHNINKPPWLPHILRRLAQIENVNLLPLLIEKFKLIFLSEWSDSGDDQGPQVIEALVFLGEPAKVAIEKLLNETKTDNEYFTKAADQVLKEIDQKRNLERTLREHYPEYLK